MRQITKFYPITRKLDNASSIVCVCVTTKRHWRHWRSTQPSIPSRTENE